MLVRRKANHERGLTQTFLSQVPVEVTKIVEKEIIKEIEVPVEIKVRASAESRSS